MIPGMPDRDFFCFPSLHGTDRYRLYWNQRDVPTAAGPGVLSNRQRMKIHDSGGKFSKLSGWRRSIDKFAGATWGIVKRPMFHVSLPSLHHEATNSGIPALSIFCRICLGEVKICLRHPKVFANPIEA